MPKLQGLGFLENTLNSLKAQAEELRGNVDAKRDWWEEKSEPWQDSDAGQEWADHLDDVEQFLDRIDELEIPS